MDTVTSDGSQPAASSSLQLEADSATSSVADVVSLQSGSEMSETARSGSTVDRDQSGIDGVPRREDRHRSGGNLSSVSEESGSKSVNQGSFLVGHLPL